MTIVRARRAFTLLELLLVVGVLVAIAAIALPYGTDALDRHAFERAVDDTLSQALAARAWAQREGAVVELVVTEDGARVEVRNVDLLREAEDGDQGAASVDGMDAALRGSRKAQRLKAQMERRVADVAARTGVHAEQGGAIDDGGFDARIPEAWASRALDGGIRAGAQPPQQADERAEFSASAGDERIALFLPDGSAAAVRPLWIGMGARSARIDIDPLLGEVRRADASAPRAGNAAQDAGERAITDRTSTDRARAGAAR